MSEILKVQNLYKSYFLEKTEIPVLKDIHFQINKGEMVTIVGASGAGKSTLLHIMGALDHPSVGDVFYEGEPLFKKSQNALAVFRNEKLGFVFQFHHLLPEFTALENVMMPVLISGARRSEAEQRAGEQLKRVGLSERFQHKPGELSGGEQQRVAIARALVTRPAILMADEPTGNLDTKTGNQIMKLLLELNAEQQMTMILVTHNEHVAKEIPRRYRMDDGMLTQAG